MTIVAGLLCLDGIVLAADTQEGGYLKNDVLKYQYARTATWLGAVMGAGSGEYADMCQQKILHRFAATEASPEPSLSDIEAYALELFHTHFAPLGVYPELERPDAKMIIAIQPRERYGSLLTWHQTAFVRRDPYAFVGVGAEMAQHLFEQFRYAAPHLRPMRIAAGLLIYIVSQIKAMIRDCGGQTELSMMGRDGHIYYLSEERISRREEKYRNLDARVMKSLAEYIMDDCEKELAENDRIEEAKLKTQCAPVNGT
jgi:hypothetical protein